MIRRGYLEDFLKESNSSLASELNAHFIEDMLLATEVANVTDGGIDIRNIGVLMFTERADKLIPGAQIDLVKFNTTEAEASDDFIEKSFTGPIWKQVKDALDYIKTNVIVEKVVKIQNQAESERFYNYPYNALEEALVNAVFHKSYREPEPVEIRVYVDSIQIINYPGLAKWIDVEKFAAGKARARKYHPEIARIVDIWFNCYDLNGNNKSIDGLDGVLTRFKDLKVYKNETAESETEEVQEVLTETQPEVKKDEEAGKEKDIEVKGMEEAGEENEAEPDDDESEGVEEEYEEEDSATSKKRKTTFAGEIKYSIYGEEFAGNQSDVMIMTFGKVLKRHPEYIEEAIGKFTCLSDVDYTDEKNRMDMPTYFRVCYTFDFEGKKVCVGTSYGMPDKLKLMAKLLMLVGEERSVLQIEGIELPVVKMGKGTTKSGEEIYLVAGNKKQGNQSNMMWDVFEALAQSYPEKIDGLVTLSCVKQAKKVVNPNTSQADPVYFRGCKSFEVNGVEYLVGTSYSRAAKLTLISKMISLCGAPDDFFVIEGEQMSRNTVTRKKKEYQI